MKCSIHLSQYFLQSPVAMQVYVVFMECRVMLCFRFVPKFWRNILRIAVKVLTECSHKFPVIVYQTRGSKSEDSLRQKNAMTKSNVTGRNY
jgi:hypothetical protein